MPKVYYVNSATGSDSNTGLSAGQPLASIDAVEKLKLDAGDSVLFARGTGYADELTLKYSGSVANPITIGAYGEGDNPVFHGGERGISGSKTSNIVIQDITITDTKGNAIYAGGATNWVVDNVTVIDTGTLRAGAISFQSSTNMTIKDSTISGTNGDGVWIDKVKGVTLEGNTINAVRGHNADNVQIGNSTDVIVRDNTLDMTGSTGSAKGNLVVNTSQNVLVDGNTMVGGGFGASINSTDVAITNNEIYGQNGYKWSFGIGAGETWDVSNYFISGNYIHDVRYGVALTGLRSDPVTRANVDIVNNTFEHLSGAALKIDQASSGEFSGNHINVDTKMAEISAEVKNSGTFDVGDNSTFVNIDPTANADLVTIAADDNGMIGNILANDESMTNATLKVASVNGVAMQDAMTLTGQYGVLTVLKDGSYTYLVDAGKMNTIDHAVSDDFSYFVTDGKHQATAQLTINVEARPNEAPHLEQDLGAISKTGPATGNLLANDSDANGNHLTVAKVGGYNFGDEPLTLAGKYGTLTIDRDGSYIYAVDPAKMAGLAKGTTEDFSYHATDGRAISESKLSIALDQYVPAVPKVNVKPVAVDEGYKTDSHGLAHGNILANDYDPNGAAVYLRTVAAAKVGSGATTLQGDYGVLRISSNGEFIYEVDQHKIAGLSNTVRESFSYKISDGSLQDVGRLSFAIDLHALGANDLMI